MIDPALLASTPFDNRTAYRDLIGQIALLHNALIPAIAALTGAAVKRMPIDANADAADLLQSIQAQHAAEAVALGIAAPPDLESFDLEDPADFASWTFVISNDLTRLKAAAGVP